MQKFHEKKIKQLGLRITQSSKKLQPQLEYIKIRTAIRNNASKQHTYSNTGIHLMRYAYHTSWYSATLICQFIEKQTKMSTKLEQVIHFCYRYF